MSDNLHGRMSGHRDGRNLVGQEVARLSDDNADRLIGTITKHTADDDYVLVRWYAGGPDMHEALDELTPVTPRGSTRDCVAFGVGCGGVMSIRHYTVGPASIHEWVCNRCGAVRALNFDS